MELWLYLALLVISLILVALSLYRPEHSELGIVGFIFIFILSFVMIGGDIQYKIGVNETNHYACLCCEGGSVIGEPIRGEPSQGCTSENATLSIVSVEKVDVYGTFTAGGILSHTVGYWLAILSVVGMIGIFVGIKTEGFMQS